MNKFSSTKSWGGFDRSLSRYETALIGSALAGLAIGLFATVTRKAAMQAPTALAPDWVEGLTREHKAVLTLFDKLEATERSQTGKRKSSSSSSRSPNMRSRRRMSSIPRCARQARKARSTAFPTIMPQ